jgi:hypothetical protein
MRVAKESPYFTAGFGLMVRTPIFDGVYVSFSGVRASWVAVVGLVNAISDLPSSSWEILDDKCPAHRR